ncbi:MAG: site-specific DNA-methyltransferase [Chloroflexi bacterium]|nr:site-specific DNA-methyltransferase [Chloroflexota bacterium]
MTNILDSLLERVDDTALRAALASEIAHLRDTREFGLVFERHIPESVRLPSYPVKRGVKVQDRTDPKSSTWVVTRVKNGVATLLNNEGVESRRPVEQLAVVREFGEPVYPGLRLVGRVERGGNKPYHAVINAENYYALEALLYIYEGRIDCIYIDPPYNTGTRDWKYNNNYVDRNDLWRHSKWLSMMERRLRLAKKLLAPDAVLIVTIDEHEVAHLGVLLEQMFPDARRQMVTIVNNAAGVSQGGFYRVEEYAYFCFLGTAHPTAVTDDLLSDEGLKTPIWRQLNRYSGTNVSAIKRPGLVYPIIIDEKRVRIIGTGRTLKERADAGEVQGGLNAWRPDPAETVDGHPVVWPFKGDGSLSTWEVNPASLLALATEGFARVRKQGKIDAPDGYSLTYVKSGNRTKVGKGTIESHGREPDGGPLILGDADRMVVPKTVWRRTRHDAGKWGSRTLRELLGIVAFEYSKSPYAVLDTLRAIVGNKPDAIILDFFAGSGTTLQSVAMLNAEDGGARRCLLVTNNQVDDDTARQLDADGHYEGDEVYEDAGICRAVTIPRILAALTGNRADGTPVPGEYISGDAIADGFEENCAFFDLAYLDRNEVARGRAFEAISPLLWLKVGAVGARIEKVKKPFAMPEDARYGVLFDIARWQPFAEALRARPDVTHAFVVTDSLAQYQQVVAELPPTVDASMLFEDYLRNFEINTGGAS